MVASVRVVGDEVTSANNQVSWDCPRVQRVEVSLHQARGAGRLRVRDRDSVAFAAVRAAQSELAHQALDDETGRIGSFTEQLQSQCPGPIDAAIRSISSENIAIEQSITDFTP